MSHAKTSDEEAAVLSLLGISKAQANPLPSSAASVPSGEGPPQGAKSHNQSEGPASHSLQAEEDRFADAAENEASNATNAASKKTSFQAVPDQFEDAEGDPPVAVPPASNPSASSAASEGVTGPVLTASSTQGVVAPFHVNFPLSGMMNLPLQNSLSSNFSAVHGPPMNAQQLQYHLWLQQQAAIAQRNAASFLEAQAQGHNRAGTDASTISTPQITQFALQNEQTRSNTTAPMASAATFAPRPLSNNSGASATTASHAAHEQDSSTHSTNPYFPKDPTTTLSAHEKSSAEASASGVLKRKLPIAMTASEGTAKKASRTTESKELSSSNSTAEQSINLNPYGITKDPRSAGEYLKPGLPQHLKGRPTAKRKIPQLNLTPPAPAVQIMDIPMQPVVVAQKEDEPPIPYKSVGEYDILLGRGGKTNSHEGNIFYRQIVRQYRPQYQNVPKFSKAYISKCIVNYIRYKGGRFLEFRGPNKDMYAEVGDTKAVAKTSQALRENPSAKGASQDASNPNPPNFSRG